MMTRSSDMILAFHFRVTFTGLDGSHDQDSSFESTAGIQAMVPDNTTNLRRDEKTPVAVFLPVVLRRAVSQAEQSPLRQWVLRCLNEKRQDHLPEAKIEILNEEHLPVMTIVLRNVSVKSWTLGELHAQKSNLLMEEIGLSYQSVEVR